MDLTSLLYDQLDPRKLAVWWRSLNPDQKFEFAYIIEYELHRAADKYCKKADEYELHYELTHKYREFLDDLNYPVDWYMDLHMDSANYQNYVDCLSDIIGDLATINDDWFYEIFRLMPKLSEDALKNVFIRYIENMPVWKE